MSYILFPKSQFKKNMIDKSPFVKERMVTFKPRNYNTVSAFEGGVCDVILLKLDSVLPGGSSLTAFP